MLGMDAQPAGLFLVFDARRFLCDCFSGRVESRGFRIYRKLAFLLKPIKPARSTDYVR